MGQCYESAGTGLDHSPGTGRQNSLIKKKRHEFHVLKSSMFPLEGGILQEFKSPFMETTGYAT
jgi:hypothetical protein